MTEQPGVKRPNLKTVRVQRPAKAGTFVSDGIAQNFRNALSSAAALAAKGRLVFQLTIDRAASVYEFFYPGWRVPIKPGYGP